MEQSRDDVGIAIRSALLSGGTKQKFSLVALIILSIFLIFVEKLDIKPLNYFRSFIEDGIYRGAVIVFAPAKAVNSISITIQDHFKLYDNYNKLKVQNSELKNNISKSDFLELENTQLRKLIEEKDALKSNYIMSRVILDKQSIYLNSFIINVGGNKNIKNGMTVLDGPNFIGRIVDVNYFSSRVLLISDLNSKIPVVIEPSGYQAILSGHGKNNPSLEYLPKNYNIEDGDKVYTSGKDGIFSPGIPIGEVKIEKDLVKVKLFSNLDQINFVRIKLESLEK